MDNNKKLDSVLRILNKEITLISYDAIVDKTKANLNLKDFTELRAILNKLVKDGYAESVTINKHDLNTRERYKEDDYRISFEGKIFIDSGGYAVYYASLYEERNETNRIRNLQIDLQRKLNQLTCWVAVASAIAAIYYTIEILKYFCVLPKTF